MEIGLSCHRRKVAESKTTHHFCDNQLQASNTLLQTEHSSSSVRGKSRSSTLRLANQVATQRNQEQQGHGALSMGRKINQVNRNTSKRAPSIQTKCSFNIGIFCAYPSGLWYVALAPENKASCKHTYHIRVDPMHLVVHRNDIDEHIRKQIKIMIKSGCSNTSIRNTIFTSFNITTSIHQISAFREDFINEIINECSNNTNDPPPKSSVDRLIKLFRAMDKVNYVYVKHSMNSGFVTYTKGRKRTTDISDSLRLDVEEWRKALRIGNEEEILVSFAWCHDEEKRKLIMFPELLCGDMTFGLNKERRNLVIFSGVDGNNKAYTAFRCWMPSKQSVAYQWAISVALPSLAGNNVTMKTRVICSDAEHSLVEAFRNTILSPKGSFQNAKYRKDFYHLVTQPWRKFIGTCKDNDSHPKFHIYSRTVYQWIKSWSCYTESEAEFKISYKKLEVFLVKYQHILGPIFLHHSKKIIESVTQNIQNTGHHIFFRSTTFGFLGSTIVESSNAGIKYGDMKCSNNMRIDTSSKKQLDQVEKKTFESNISMASQINETVHYTRSNTSDYLTRYMHGLCIKNFDNRIHFHVCYRGANEWYVMEKKLLQEMLESSKSGVDTAPTTDDERPRYTRFVRVRKVRVVNNKFMTCSCGYVQRYLAPCHHIMAVLSEKEYIIPSLFHLRWFKHFNYYFGDEFCTNEMTDVHDSMYRLYNKSHKDFFSDANYIGCSIVDNNFFKNNHVIDDNSEFGVLMDVIERITFEQGPLQKGCNSYINYLPWVRDEEELLFDNGNNSEDEMRIHEMNEHGFGNIMSQEDNTDTNANPTTVHGEMSQRSIELDGYVDEIIPETCNERGGDLWNRVEEFISTIKTTEQRDRFISFMRKELPRNIAENNPNYSEKNRGTLMLGSDESGKRDCPKRKRQFYES